MKRTAALKVVDAGKHVFEYEIGLGGHHHCVVWPFDRFMSDLCMNPERYWHELIYPDRPCRLYMDCEKNLKEGETVDEVAFINEIQAEMVAEIGDLGMPIVLRASRSTKFSIHLVWDRWAASPSVVFGIATRVSLRIKGPVTIDLQVYPRSSSPRTLRMPYSSKRTESCPLLPIDHPKFDPVIFCASLITFQTKDSLKWKLPPISQELLVATGDEVDGRSKQARVLLDSVGETFQPVLDWLDISRPLFHANKIQAYEDGGFSAYTDFFCMIQRRWHKGNKMYLHMDTKGTIYVLCSDEECRRKVILPFTLNQIRVSETKVNLDWDILNAVYKPLKKE